MLMFTQHLFHGDVIFIKTNSKGAINGVFSRDIHMCKEHSFHLDNIFRKLSDELLLSDSSNYPSN